MSVEIVDVAMGGSKCIPLTVDITFNTGDKVTYSMSLNERPRGASRSFRKLTNFATPTYDLDEKDDSLSFEGLEKKWQEHLVEIQSLYKTALSEAERINRLEIADIKNNYIKQRNAQWNIQLNLQKAMKDDFTKAETEVNGKLNSLKDTSYRLRKMVTWLRNAKVNCMSEAAELLEAEERYITKVPATSCKWDGFLSHVNKEKTDTCRNIEYALSQGGIKVWYDKTAIWSDNHGMIDGVRGSKLFIIVLSKSYFSRPYCLFEFSVAAVLDRPYITIFPSDQEIKSFKPHAMFKHVRKHQFTIMDHDYWNAFIKKLCERMNAKIAERRNWKLKTPRATILKEEEEGWLTKQLEKENCKVWKRLYASWEDGGDTKSFHAPWYDLEKIITVIRVRTGLYFGAFTEVIWPSTVPTSVQRKTSWLFHLKDGQNKRYNIERPNSANITVKHLYGAEYNLNIKALAIDYLRYIISEAGRQSPNLMEFFTLPEIAVYCCIKTVH